MSQGGTLRPYASARGDTARRRWWSIVRREVLDTVVWHFRVAWLQEQRGRLGAAEAGYRRVLARRPDQLHALSSLGFLLLRARRFDEAVLIWEQAVAVDTQGVSANFQLARALHRSGEVKQAAQQYLRVLALDPLHDKSLEALGQLGRRLARLGLEPSGPNGSIAGPIGHDQAQAGAAALAAGICAAASVLTSRAPDVALQQFRMALSLVPDLPEALNGVTECERQLDRQSGEPAHAAPTEGDDVRPARLTPTEVDDVRRARSAYNESRLDAAEEICRRVLATDELNIPALSLLARLCMRTSRWHEAILLLARVVTAQPGALDAKEMLASALLLDNQPAVAATLYEELHALQPKNGRILHTLGRIYGRLRDWDAACRTLGHLVELDSSVVQSRLAYGEALHQAGRLHEAERQFEAALSAQPGNADALTLLGRMRSKNDPERALDCWTRLAEIRPAAVEPPLQMARIRMSQRRHTEAQPLFRLVLDLDANHAEALRGLGHALAEINLTEAIQHFARLAERSPDDPTAWLELARHRLKAREWDRAEEVYRKILGRQPRHREALTQLAQLLARDLRRLDEALELWRRVAETDSTAPYPLVQRAYLLERVRRTTDAEAEYRAALQRSAKDAMALMGLARLLSGQKRWNEAVQYFTALHEVDPRRSDALLGLGRCLERLDCGDDALAAYEKVIALDPANGNALLYRGRLLRHLGRSEEAIEAWRQVCAHTPQNTDAWHELVFLLASADRDADALAALDAAEASLPAVAKTWVRLGLAAQAGQFHDRAVGYFEKAVAAAPHEASHRALLGQYYFRQGIVDRAFHHLLASRELEPSDVRVTKQLVDTVHTLNVMGIDHLSLAAAERPRGDILVPERLFRLVRDIADTRIRPYQSNPRCVIAVTASLAAGGAERQLVNMLRGLSDPAFDLDLSLFCISLVRRTRRDFFLPLLANTPVEIVTPDEEALERHLSDPAVLPHARLIRSFPPEMAAPIAFWLGEFRRRRPQVVHAWQDSTSLTAAVAGLLAGVPRIVLAARSVRPDNPRRRLKRFMHDAYQAVLGHPSVVLTNNSRAGANDYAAWLALDPASIAVVYNGIDFERMAQSVDPERARRLRQSFGMPSDAVLIGSAFRMSEEKRPFLWVEVAAEVARREPRAHFVVYGDGPMRTGMADLAKRLGIADRLHLPGPEDNIASCYKAMDVVMLTSRHEGLPNVLLEAQSLGVPVVAPDVGGASETVWPGVTGWTIRDATAASLAERVLQCVADTGWAARARSEAPSFVRERFGMATMLQRTLDVYGLTRPDRGGSLASPGIVARRSTC